MNIQSISSNYFQPQAQNSARSDFKTFKEDLQSLQGALSSGNQDQVATSQSALSSALTQLMSDFSNNTQGQSSAVGNAQAQNPMQTFQSDLQTLQSALSSTNSSQGTASSNSTLATALNNVVNDLSAMKGHGHHHHHHADGDNSDSSIAGIGQTQNPMQAFQSDLQTLQSALSSTSSSLGASASGSTLSAAVTNVMNDLSAMNSQGATVSNPNPGTQLSQILSLFSQGQLASSTNIINTLA